MINIEAIRPSNYYTIADVCMIFGKHRNTIRNWTESGKLKARYNRLTMRPTYLGRELIKFANNLI